MEFRVKLKKSIEKVEKWVEDHHYKGHEPFDGLSSILRPLTFRNLFLERLLQQLVRQSPINLRPMLGISPRIHERARLYGLGLFADVQDHARPLL